MADPRMRRGQARPLRGPRQSFVATALIATVLLAGCGAAAGAPAALTVVPPPLGGLVATLEDEVRELPGERVAWSTTWQLCWDPYPAATAYELRRLTAEGASRRLVRLADRCFRLESAVGEHAASEWRAARALQLALAADQLGYQVRAVLDHTRASEWSARIAVGDGSPLEKPGPGDEHER